MMRLHGHLWAAIGTYTTADGKKAKTRLRVGAILRDTNTGRMSVRLDAIPTARGWSGWLSVSTPETARNFEDDPAGAENAGDGQEETC